MGTHTTLRRIAGVLAAVVLAPATLLATAGPASAEDGYKYWNYFQVENEAYAFAQKGPADTTPRDGAVEGWRFGTSTEQVGIEPRADLAETGFDQVCEGTDSGDGEKRVAVLVDYGTEADAPGGSTPVEPTAYCAVVPEDASGLQTLESVADVRTEQGGICAIDGYPASGPCFDTVKDAQVEKDQATVAFALPAAATAATDSEAPSDDASATAGDSTDEASAEDEGGISWPLVAVIALVVVIGAVAIPLSRRNRDS
ncbi:SCO2322 family protein [Nocardioides iriomotensis]|uniref:SCO2322 family protein n=1 Tax=Nocardioides iriomotensis TaxID=715784 RepID=UPI0013E9BA2F|nr:SCO2322 family protein [Nocardioides iriomotensis]